jgi:hypothetical protein
VLFQEIDVTDVQRVRGERDQRLRRIDAGIQAVKSAAEKIRQAGVAIPESSTIPDDEIRANALTEDGEKLGAGLVEALQRVEQARAEVAAGEELIRKRRAEIAAAETSRKIELAKNIKNGLRFLGLFLLILYVKWCIGRLK